MLHKDPFVISPQTFVLIQELQALPEFKDFYLVGGTALALQLGHRNSIDIDLFTNTSFSPESISGVLNGRFLFEITFSKNNAVLSRINGIKTDFIRHDYPLLDQALAEEGITFLGLKDIAAMKMHAIIQSGKRLKDFIDIYFLLEHFSLNQMAVFFDQKYQHMSQLIAIRAVNFFDDIDENIDPPKLVKPLKIAKIKERIRQATLHANTIFNHED